MSLIEINEEMFKIKWSIKRHCFANVRTLGLTDTPSTRTDKGVLIYFALFERSLKHKGQQIKRRPTYGYVQQKIYSLTCPF